MVKKRLPFDARRLQLLDTAAAIVREEGADALTLGHLAKVAGVTKPIAYDHFENRAGLLEALYRRIDDQQCEAARQAADTGAKTLESVCSILAVSYVDCVLHIGKEYGSITAALSTFPHADAFLRDGRERYASIYLEALEEFAPMRESGGIAIMLGVIGAAEALAREVTAERLSRQAAIDAIDKIILGAVRSHTVAPARG